MPSGSGSSWPERCESAVTLSHQSGFPSKPPLGKWEFNAWPQGLGAGLVAPVGQGETIPALVSLSSLLQPFCLAVPGTAHASGLPHTQCCLFPDVYRCFLFEGTDRWLQAVE